MEILIIMAIVVVVCIIVGIIFIYRKSIESCCDLPPENTNSRYSVRNESRSATLSRESDHSERFSNSDNLTSSSFIPLRSVNFARNSQCTSHIKSYPSKSPPGGRNSLAISQLESDSSTNSDSTGAFSPAKRRAPYPTDSEINKSRYPMKNIRTDSYPSTRRAPYPGDSEIDRFLFPKPTTRTDFYSSASRAPYPTDSEIEGSRYPIPTLRSDSFFSLSKTPYPTDAVTIGGFSDRAVLGPSKRAPYPTDSEIEESQYPMPTQASHTFSLPSRAPYPTDSELEGSRYPMPNTKSYSFSPSSRAPYPTDSEIDESRYPMPTPRPDPYSSLSKAPYPTDTSIGGFSGVAVLDAPKKTPYPTDSEIESSPYPMPTRRFDTFSLPSRAPYPTDSATEGRQYSFSSPNAPPYSADLEIECSPNIAPSTRTDSFCFTSRAPYPTGSELGTSPNALPPTRTISKTKAPYPLTTSHFFPLPSIASTSERTSSRRIATSSDANIQHPTPGPTLSTKEPPPSYSEVVGDTNI